MHSNHINMFFFHRTNIEMSMEAATSCKIGSPWKDFKIAVLCLIHRLSLIILSFLKIAYPGLMEYST